MVVKPLIFTLYLVAISTLVSFSQVKDGVVLGSGDSTTVETADSTLMKKHSPKRASVMSAILPGAGQVYNGKYWKLPLIYGAGGAMIYLAIRSNRNYQLYRETLITRLDSTYNGTDHFPEIPNVAPNTAIQEEMERTRKNMELAIIGASLVYILQIVDAAVDAHLKYYDVSDDLSMLVKPKVYLPQNTLAMGANPPMLGFQLNLKFK